MHASVYMPCKCILVPKVKVRKNDVKLKDFPCPTVPEKVSLRVSRLMSRLSDSSASHRACDPPPLYIAPYLFELCCLFVFLHYVFKNRSCDFNKVKE